MGSRVVVTLALAALAWPASATAAQPVPGGRYLLMRKASIYATDYGGVLQLTAGGRALSSNGIPFSPVWRRYFGSYLQTTVRCGSGSEVADFFFGAPQHAPAAVDRGGRFAVVGTGDQAADGSTNTVELRGRFVSRSAAVVRVVGGSYRPTGSAEACSIPRRTFRFRLRPMPSFGTCASAPGRTVMRTGRSRIYKTWGVDETGRQTYAYGCVRDGAAVPLGGTSAGFDGSVGRFRLAGPYASFVYAVNNEGGQSEVLGVVDLRGRGRTVRAIGPSPDDQDVDHFAATPLLSARGVSAWVAQRCDQETRRCAPPYEVWIADRAGPRRVDEGAAIDPRSLALRGSRVSWTNGGQRRSA